jgi:cytochrome oxidase assembly protein ShyY1
MDVGWRAGLSVIIVAAIALLTFLGLWVYKRHKRIVQAEALAEEHELGTAVSRPPHEFLRGRGR